MEGKRRKLIAALTVGLVIAGGVAAYAYFTSTGSGTGTAAVGTATTTWDVDVTVGANILYPGHGSNGITVTVTNDGSGNQLLDEIVATVEPPTGTGSDGSIPACTAADFALSGGTWVISNGGTTATLSGIGADLDPNDDYANNTLSVSMNNLNQNQNNCQNATVNLSFDAS